MRVGSTIFGGRPLKAPNQSGADSTADNSKPSKTPDDTAQVNSTQVDLPTQHMQQLALSWSSESSFLLILTTPSHQLEDLQPPSFQLKLCMCENTEDNEGKTCNETKTLKENCQVISIHKIFSPMIWLVWKKLLHAEWKGVKITFPEMIHANRC